MKTRRLAAIARVLMGLIFLVMGLNGFLNFIPQPSTPMPAGALAFLGAFLLEIYLASVYRAAFRPMLAMRVVPDPD